MAGPLRGVKLVEMVNVGPAPYASMLLADMGAEVIRIERPGGGIHSYPGKFDLLNRNKRCICIDLKTARGKDLALQLITLADGLIEGFRPGVMERLGLGPDICLERNPRLVYGRMTGWGQDGPLADKTGHDLNYIAIAGALHPIARVNEKPAVPLQLVGDFAGGSQFLALGMVSALFETSRSGQGQVIDAAIVEGAAHLMTPIFAAQQVGYWSEQPGTNLIDSGAPFYNVYETADGKYVAIGAIEAPFYTELLAGLGLADSDLPDQHDTAQWPAMKARFATVIATKTRDEWAAVFEGSNACCYPVLTMSEVRHHPQHQARGTFVEDNDVWQPRPVPRFSRTENNHISKPVGLGANTDEILQELGYSESACNELHDSGVVA